MKWCGIAYRICTVFKIHFLWWVFFSLFMINDKISLWNINQAWMMWLECEMKFQCHTEKTNQSEEWAPDAERESKELKKITTSTLLISVIHSEITLWVTAWCLNFYNGKNNRNRFNLIFILLFSLRYLSQYPFLYSSPQICAVSPTSMPTPQPMESSQLLQLKNANALSISK